MRKLFGIRVMVNGVITHEQSVSAIDAEGASRVFDRHWPHNIFNVPGASFIVTGEI